MPLVKAVQELAQQNNELSSALLTKEKNYQAKIDDLQKQIDELKHLLISKKSEVAEGKETASK